MLKHRNSQKRIIFSDACYFVTSNTFNWYPFFKEPIFCDLFVENLRLCKRLKGFLLFGWVLVYNHFHLMVMPEDNWNISDVMFSIKKQFSHNVNRVMGFNKIPVYPEGRQALVRLHVCGILRHNENWVYVSKFDQYVHKLKNRFCQKYKNRNPYPKFQWHESFHDHFIRNENDFNYHIDYIEYNPEKHHLPLDWPYISFNLAYRQAGPKYDDLTDEC